jgi:hypothetical protein
MNRLELLTIKGARLRPSSASRGSAAPQCGKALPYRVNALQFPRLRRPLRQALPDSLKLPLNVLHGAIVLPQPFALFVLFLHGSLFIHLGTLSPSNLKSVVSKLDSAG